MGKEEILNISCHVCPCIILLGSGRWQSLKVKEHNGPQYLRYIEIIGQCTPNVYEGSEEAIPNTTRNHSTGCRINMAMHKAVEQILTTMSLDSIPTIVLSQA